MAAKIHLHTYQRNHEGILKKAALLKLLAPCLAVLLIVGCVSHVPLQRAQVDSFRTGDSASDLQAKLGKSTPTLEHSFDYAGGQYLARHFNLQTGMQQSGTVVCTPSCMYIPIMVPVYTQFVIVYGDAGKTVRAYGTLEELSKSPEESVSAFMPSLKLAMEKAQAEKKKG